MNRLDRRVVARLLNSPAGRLLPARARLRLHDLLGRSDRERELHLLHRLGPNRGMAIDAGANIGMYTLRMSQLYSRVVAFEPNPLLAKQLQDARLPNVDVIQAALSDFCTETELQIPMQNGRPLWGWGTVETAAFPGQAVATFRVKTVRLDDYDFHDVTFLKIDVEGHELRLLAGAMRTIARWRPIILCEAKGDNLKRVEEMLVPLGYRRGTLKEWVGTEGTPDNWLFNAEARTDAA
jgi:FkbM family methyltransferase